MSDHRYIPISCADDSLLLPLMEEEENVWMSELGWDYSPIRKILLSFMAQRLLPGYIAMSEKKPVGYTYFLVNQAKGVIGSLYVAKTSRSQEAVEKLLSLTISCLKDSQSTHRIEAQIMPFHNLNLTATFTQHGFFYYPRYYLELDLNAFSGMKSSTFGEKIVPWNSASLQQMAEMTSVSYNGEIDAEICGDYRSTSGCASYLRSLVDNPGCGIFMSDASFMSLDAQGRPCGYIICCRIADGAGMIPQIAIHPSYQGRGFGSALINRSFDQLKSQGFDTVSLTVTKKNRRAFDWYQRLGFRIRKEFGAYVWER